MTLNSINSIIIHFTERLKFKVPQLIYENPRLKSSRLILKHNSRDAKLNKLSAWHTTHLVNLSLYLYIFLLYLNTNFLTIQIK